MSAGQQHVQDLAEALAGFTAQVEVSQRWGRRLADVLAGDGRLLVAGNGGSAAEAQHLTAEIVGRFRDDRRPYSALALHADTSALTAILNDYGPREVFARQVLAHGRPGDICVLLSTSGSSSNILAAAEQARGRGLTTWAMTGREPNPLVTLCDEALCVDAATTATVQELHLVAVHLMCAAFDDALLDASNALRGTR